MSFTGSSRNPGSSSRSAWKDVSGDGETSFHSDVPTLSAEHFSSDSPLITAEYGSGPLPMETADPIQRKKQTISYILYSIMSGSAFLFTKIAKKVG